MNTLEVDKKLEDIEKDVRVSGGDVSLSRRAGRILRIKIYFLFHGRGCFYVRNLLGWADSLPVGVKAILSFIVAMLALSVPISSGALAYYGVPGIFLFFTGMAGFMVMMLPVILYVVIIYMAFSTMNRLADHYF